MKYLTENFLKVNDACKDGFEFFRKHKLYLFPLEKINEIEGDYHYYIDWLKQTLNNGNLYDFDDTGKITKIVTKLDSEFCFEYNDRGDISFEKHIYKHYTLNITNEFEYDENGNIITAISNGQFMYRYRYDYRNNLTMVIDEDNIVVNVYEYEYDENDNITSEYRSDYDEFVNYEYLNGKIHKVYKNKELVLVFPEF